MRLPSTFFLRLDSHQAAIVVGIFELLFHVPSFFVLVLIQVVVSPTNKAFGKEFEKERRELQFILDIINFFNFFEIVNVLSIVLMVYAVLCRKKWIVIPWIIVTTLDVLNLFCQYRTLPDLVLKLNTAEMGAIILSLTFVEFFNIIASGLMIYAVIYRKKRFILPWFIIAGINILSLISQYVFLLVYVQTLKTALMGAILLTTLYILILLIEAYSALAVFCSFRDIANPETLNRAVQFQPISSLMNAPTPRD